MSSKKSLATTRRVEDSLSNTPCKTNEEILARQRECLRQTIVEAGKAEEKRLFALEIEKNSRRKQELSARFDEQRSRDQEKITRLQNDYLSLKNSIESGNVDFSHNIEERQNLTLKFTPANKNRFEGFDTQENIEFQKILTQKLEKYDKKFNNSVSSKPFDRQAEYRKLELLNQKRDVLRQMIDLQRLEVNDPNYSSRTTSRTSSTSRSSRSDISSGSDYSWATFATSNVAMPKIASKSHSHKHVPPLNL